LSQGSKKVSHLQKFFIVMEGARKETIQGKQDLMHFPSMKYAIKRYRTLSNSSLFLLVGSKISPINTVRIFLFKVTV